MPIEFRSTIRGPLRRLYICTFVACLGMGLTLSLFVVYLHNVRHFSTSFATLLLALSAVIGLGSGPLWGSLTDRVGPLPVLLASSAADAGSLVVLALAHTREQAILAAVLLAVFGSAGWGPASVLISRVVTPELRQRAFGVNFMLVNLGIGFGGLASASIVDLSHPDSFVLLYVANAGVMFIAGLCYLSLRKYGGPVKEHHDDPVKMAEGWREVLHDGRIVRYAIASIVLMIGGYGSLDAGLSLFVVNNLKLSVHAIAVIFFFNTATIVLAQLWVLNRIEGKSRTRVMGIVAACWFTFWMILESTLATPKPLAVAMLCLAMVIFALGETVLQPVGSALVNEIAPEHLRGRYNAAAGLSWSISGTLAPAITALYFSVHLGNWWPLGTGVAALIGGALMMNLRRHISVQADGRASVVSNAATT